MLHQIILALLFLMNLATLKLYMPGVEGLKKDKLDECARCKVLTDSFDNWIHKTSRGKYEGGDAAWEESKLKSYARSEIRLVEIQERICSELSKYQDYCYSLSEESEQFLEKWWFQEDPNSIDLHTWLCIDTLKYCCPMNHFGNNCSPCPIDKNQLICNGRGKCDGNGTRKGNGTCICDKAYRGYNCEACNINFYSDINGSCKQCHKACESCSGEGNGACLSCKAGWKMAESGVCIDIDECISSSICKSYELCINKEGSFKCKPCDSSCKTCAGLGAKNCTSCDSHKQLWGGMCITRNNFEDILMDALKRCSMYIVGILLFIVYIRMYKIYSFLKSVIVVLFAILVYYLETRSNVNTYDVVMNLYENYGQIHIFSVFARRISKITS